MGFTGIASVGSILKSRSKFYDTPSGQFFYLKIATIAKCEGKAYGDDLNIEIVKACEREYRQKSDKKITLWL